MNSRVFLKKLCFNDLISCVILILSSVSVCSSLRWPVLMLAWHGHFLRYWSFVRGIQQSPVYSPHKHTVMQSFKMDGIFGVSLMKPLNRQLSDQLNEMVYDSCEVTLMTEWGYRLPMFRWVTQGQHWTLSSRSQMWLPTPQVSGLDVLIGMPQQMWAILALFTWQVIIMECRGKAFEQFRIDLALFLVNCVSSVCIFVQHILFPHNHGSGLLKTVFQDFNSRFSCVNIVFEIAFHDQVVHNVVVSTLKYSIVISTGSQPLLLWASERLPVSSTLNVAQLWSFECDMNILLFLLSGNIVMI